MIADLEKLANKYLSVLVFPSKTPLTNNTWDIKHQEGLTGIIAFTKWSIPQKKAFYKCKNLTFILGVCPTLGNDMRGMFYEASNFNQPLNEWDVSSVNNMECMFYGAYNFNQPLNAWDVSSVTDMEFMFWQASNFNQPLNDWDVSSVTNMWHMFAGAFSFNQPLNDWDVSSVTNMEFMFEGSKMLELPEWHH